MRTIIIKNLSTVKDAIVVEIISDIMARDDGILDRDVIAENALDLHGLEYKETLDRFRNSVTFTVTDCGAQFDGKERRREGSET